MRPGKILIIQLRQIGDVLLTTPVAEVLRANFPEARIDFLTQPPCDQALAGNPHIDRVLAYDRRRPLGMLLDVRRAGYDLVIDFMSNPRSALLTFASGAAVKAGPDYTASAWAYNRKFTLLPGRHDYNPFLKIDLAAQLGLERVFYPYPKLYPSASDEAWAGAAMAGLGLTKENTIALAPASRRETRRWPAEHYARLGAMAAELGLNVLVLWGPGEKALADEVASASGSPAVRTAPETSTLGRLSSLLRRTSILVSNCSGTKHVAQASGVPTLGVYGSSRPGSWTPPDDPLHQTVRNESLHCIGCGSNDCPDAVCLKKLSPETVFAKLVRMLPLTRQKVNNEPLS